MDKNQSYAGNILWSTSLKKDVAKIYFADINERNPFNYNWQYSGLPQRWVIGGITSFLRNSENHGIPHIFISFPHVTVGYRWGNPHMNESETNLFRVGSQKTPLLAAFKDIEYEHCPIIGCPTELYVIGQEALIRAKSATLDEYLKTFADGGDHPGSKIINPNLVRNSLIIKN